MNDKLPNNAGAGSSALTGTLSAKYESRGGAGTVSTGKGDIGGVSYGSYQMSTSSGNAQKFANQWGGALAGKKAGTTAFTNAWKAEAKKNPKAFEKAQHAYIEKTHYAPAASKFKTVTGIDPAKLPQAIKDVIWSIGVQHGSGGANNVFKNSGIKKNDSPSTIIKKIYAERRKVDKYFSSSPASTKASVKKRFYAEEKDALKML